MSNLDDFFAPSAIQVGDYIHTERTGDFLPAEGQDIFGSEFTQLDAVVVLSQMVFNTSNSPNNAMSRAFFAQASGRLGYIGLDSDVQLRRIDFKTGEVTDLTTPASVAGLFFFHACGNNTGSILHFIGASTSNNKVFCYTSINAGESWVAVEVLTGISILDAADATATPQGFYIQCDPAGENVVAVCIGTADDTTIVIKSTDFGATWGEVGTPRQTLVDADSLGQCAVSRNLLTSIIINALKVWFNSDSLTGAFIDVTANFPGDLTNTTTRMIVSDDGLVSASFNMDVRPNIAAFFVTTDDAATWFERTFTLHLGDETLNNGKLLSLRFDPNNNNVLYGIITPDANVSGLNQNFFYKFNLETFESTNIGQLGNSESVLSELIHNTVSFSANNTGFTCGFQDPSIQDKTFIAEIQTGKNLLDTSNESQPLKISSGPRTTGLGSDWTRIDSPTNADINCGYVSSDKTVIVGGLGGGGIVHSGNSGASFTLPTNGFTVTVHAIDGSDIASTLIIASQAGSLRLSTNGGTVWSAAGAVVPATVDSDGTYHVCSCTADGVNVLAVARNGTVNLSSDSGANFNQTAGTPFSAEDNTDVRSGDMAKADPDIFFLGSEGGLIKITTDGGSNFVDPTTPPVFDPNNTFVFEISCSSDGSIVMAIIGAKAFLSTNTGDTWVEVAVGFSKPSFRGLTMSADGAVILMSNGNGVIVRSNNTGATFFKVDVEWAEVRRSARGLEVSPDGTQAYSMTDDGLIYKAVL